MPMGWRQCERARAQSHAMTSMGAKGWKYIKKRPLVASFMAFIDVHRWTAHKQLQATRMAPTGFERTSRKELPSQLCERTWFGVTVAP